MSWEFFNKRTVVGRKDYRCEECGADLPKGTRHTYCSGKCEGDLTDYRLCDECELISTAWCIAYDDGEGWPMGGLRQYVCDEGHADPVSWATAVLVADKARSAERKAKADAANRLQEAVPDLLEACKRAEVALRILSEELPTILPKAAKCCAADAAVLRAALAKAAVTSSPAAGTTDPLVGKESSEPDGKLKPGITHDQP